MNPTVLSSLRRCSLASHIVRAFEPLFALDGKPTNLTKVDIERRNAIVNLLQEWKLLTIVKPDLLVPMGNVGQFKIISFKDKVDWQLVPKYNIGVKY